MPQFIATLYNVPVLSFPCPHNKHSTVQLQFLSVQITAARHAIKTGCGVGVAAVGYTCCDVLVMVADPAIKISNTLS